MSYPRNRIHRKTQRTSAVRLLTLAQFIVFTIFLVSLNGCGGGYAGGVVPGLMASHVTIDSGQSFMAVASNPQNLPLTWALSGASCSGQSCGTLSQTTSAGAMYVAPQVTKQLTVTLTSTVTGTSSSSTTTIVVNPVPQITGSTPDGTVGSAYSATFALTGGTPALKWLAVKGALPAGLTFDTTTGILSGTPTTAGSTTFTLQAIDSSDVPYTTSSPYTLKINNAGAVVPTLKASGSTPDGTVGTPYVAVLQASGGATPYTWSIVNGTLPAGLGLSSSGILAGTPTTAGTFNFTAQVQDSEGSMATLPLTLKIQDAAQTSALTLVTSTLPSGTVQIAYAASITITGGTAPYTCTIESGSLPAGLTLGSNCAVTGIPTVAGTTTFSVRATDASNPATTGTGLITIVINPAPVVLTIFSPPPATVGVPYSAAVAITGGTAPYHCVLASGAMPAGLTLGADCVVSGLPLVVGSTSVGVTVTDSANPANATTATITITVQAPLITLTVTAPPVAVVGVPYTGTILVAGGTAPYQCSLVSGTMPNGLTLGSDCVITGTPQTPGTYTVGITVTDSANPANTKSTTINITVTGSLVTLTITAPPVAVVGVPYNGLILVAGGVAPYNCAIASGSLPTGLNLGANCFISGTPQTPGTYTVNIIATDSANPANTKTSPVTITVTGSLVTLTLTAPPVAVVGVPYTGAILVAGGIAPYNCGIASGSLPTGLNLGTNCIITGTPTTAGTFAVNITATDSATPANTRTAPVTITVQPALVTLTLTAPPVAVVHVPYVGVILVAGGTAPYQCSVASGSLPAGLHLSSSCTITGTPTTAGPSTVNVAVQDSASPTNTTTAPVMITVLGPTASLTISSPADATVNTPYSAVIPVTGGTAPYTCSINSGSLPTGLAMAANCAITGTPTVAGTSTANVTATDSASPAVTGTANISIIVHPMDALTLTGTLPNATLGTQYTQTLHAAGGLAPYTYAVTAGTLPAGLSLSSQGVLSGIPTAVGASSFTVTATDSQSTRQTANLALTLQVVYPTTPYDALLNGPYAFLFQGYDDVLAGVLAYQTATIGSFNADGNGLLTVGELDSNHQASNPAGNTIATNNLLGTYTIGQDGRGTLAITTLQTDGTAGNTATYAIALKLPTAPATAATSGSMIESDGDIILSSKGSGMLLAQTASTFTNGLKGSYAFGLSGDTPCLPSCTIGLVAGPVATVGQFTSDNGTVSGVSDANIASTSYSSSDLSGSVNEADTMGRVNLTLNSSKLASIAYPTHYAVYIVDASHAFLMSTDKHSAYVLQAGTAQLQSQTTFGNASLNGPFVGYENAPVNPGLVGTTLSNVLNLSSATIFRGTGNNNGTCTTTNVDVGGLTGLVNTLTGLGSNSNILNAVLGTYQSLGNSNCNVALNGRAVFNYPNPNTLLSATLGLLGLGNNPPPARVVYLTGVNEGYFLETGYAGLGHIAPQTGAPFTVSSLHGTYTYGTVPASSLVTINGSGSFTANGSGNTTSTLDTNVGVGNLNVLQLGVTGAATYSVTDAAAGRYLLGGTRVIYALSPNRYVLLETNPLSTSPHVALLY